MDGMYTGQQGEIVFYRWRVFEQWRHRLDAVVTTRHGGFSSPPMASLNLGHRIDDEHLQRNRTLVSEALGFPNGVWAMSNQVHGVRIASLSGDEKPPFDSCDAVIIDKPGDISGVLLADCHPIMVYDPVRHVGGAAHAGWKGTLAGIPRILVNRMIADGSRRKDLWAAAGPGIGSCCYTVGDDVASQFRGEFGEGFLTRDERGEPWRLDLEGINISTLKESGIPMGQIGRGGFCTACRGHDFFSYRKENGKTGRQAAIMVLHFPNKRPNMPFFF